MSENQKQPSVWKTSIRLPLLIASLLATCGLTVVFYFSQFHNLDFYRLYIQELYEYKFLEAKVLHYLEQTKNNATDSAFIEASLMHLREQAVALCASIEKNEFGDFNVSTSSFEQAVLNKVSVTKRFLKENALHKTKMKTLADSLKVLNQTPANQLLLEKLDSLSFGVIVQKTRDLKTEKILEPFILKQEDLNRIWNRINDSQTLFLAEDLILEFKAKEQEIEGIRIKLSLLSYLISLGMLLLILSFYVRVKK